MQRAIDIFFYGLFMDRDALAAQGLHPGPSRRAAVAGYRLVIGERASLVPDPEASAWGVVIALPIDEAERLYGEPSVADYRPEAVLARQDDGTSVAALCYNLPADALSGTNASYANALCELAKKLALPADYRSYLQSLAD